MAYHEEFSVPKQVLEQLSEEGLGGLSEAIRILVNTAMRAERDAHPTGVPV